MDQRKLHLSGRFLVSAPAAGHRHPRRPSCDWRRQTSGASVPFHSMTIGGARSPRTSMASSAAVSAISSSSEKVSCVAPMLSRRCGNCVVPGIGTTDGPYAISQASATMNTHLHGKIGLFTAISDGGRRSHRYGCAGRHRRYADGRAEGHDGCARSRPRHDAARAAYRPPAPWR